MVYLLHKLSLSLIFISIGIQLFSQSREPGELISPAADELQTKLILRLGGGIPQGDYADDNLDNLDAGLAKTGILFDAELFQELNQGLYFSLTARFQVNELDPEPFADAFAFQLPPSVNIEINTNPYKLNNFMTGIGTISRLDQKTALISRFLIGFSFIAYPSLEARLSDGRTTVVERVSSVNASTFSYLVGLGLELEINPKTNLLLMGDYFGANPEFKNVPITQEINGSISSRDIADVEQEIRLINLSIGVSFKL